MCIGDQRVLWRGVHAQMAGVANRRCADPQMDFGRACFAQHGHDARSGGAAHDTVVDERDALATQHLGQRVELQVDPVLALLLLRLDKGATDIAIFDQAFAVRDPGGASEADGCRRRPCCTGPSDRAA